ncbi:MAG: TetR family transcriptional regulator [Actinophytocola sp.]|nr:TetR family transcriptional regulator [Actinophytocola sp.]
MDAERNTGAILDAAIQVLGHSPDARMEHIARAAGVSRQTLYAHFPARESLVNAVLDKLTGETLAAIDAADLDNGPAAAALIRLLDASWQTFERYPVLVNGTLTQLRQAESDERHTPVLARIERLVRRGQDAGEFDGELSPAWLVATTVALGHTAGDLADTGQLTTAEARAALNRSVLRVFGARDSAGS